MIIGECESGCEYIKSFEYEFKIYKRWILSENFNQVKWILYDFKDQVFWNTGSKELTIFKDLFLKNPNDYFKVEFIVKTISVKNGISLGSASLILAVNRPPTNGSCDISPISGYSASTLFTIECKNWEDTDGFIELYEFYSNFYKIYST